MSEFQVEGAKKTESRIYNSNNQKVVDPKEIEIDFDLNLDFI